MSDTSGGERTVRQLSDLSGRVSIVTGGAGSIGSVLCGALAEMGSRIVVADIDAGRCESTAAELEATHGTKALAEVVDLTDEDATRRIAVTTVSAFGRIDVLLNCAGMTSGPELEGWTTAFDQQTTNAWRRGIDANLTSVFVLTQACANALRESGHGSVINVSSIYGLVGPDMSIYEATDMGSAAGYAASKGGLLQLTRWLATVLAPEIRVNAITPGGVWRGQPEVFRERYEERTPLCRMAAEEDLIGAAAYLASDLSGYVTGHNLVVDGGWTVW